MNRENWMEKGVLRIYNEYLKRHPLYKKHQEALLNWNYLRRNTKGVCSYCGRKCQTHLHHIDSGLRPENVRSIPLEIIYVPVKDIVCLLPGEIIENYMRKFEIEKNIKYLSVRENEVLELCPKCHRKAHSKKGLL